MPAVRVENLVKTYGDGTQAVKGISFNVDDGEFFGFLGPNGAGKSTTIKILTTILRKSSGLANVAGLDIEHDAQKVRKLIGVQMQDTVIDEDLTGRENLMLQGHLQQMHGEELKERVNELLKVVDLGDAADKRSAYYSGGMKKRLDLASTLVHRPKILFLDEPTTGLDPRSRRTMWDIIRELVADGVTIFLTTQYLDEADRLADRIAVLDQGHLVAQGTPGELKRQIPGSHVRLRFAGDLELDSAMRILTDSTRDGEEDLILRVPSDGGAKSVRALLNQLDTHSIEVEEFSVHTPDLDDVFLALTGRTSTKVNAQ